MSSDEIINNTANELLPLQYKATKLSTKNEDMAYQLKRSLGCLSQFIITMLPNGVQILLCIVVYIQKSTTDDNN
jgi:hypothetical protein